ncbi:MAG TPA: ATP-binding protein [Kofleriaceae bacterium]|nr:ATP-binding protein [Kofleriaceae bacterium]
MKKAASDPGGPGGPGGRFHRRWMSLQVKVVVGLLVVVLAPLGASAYLIDQIGRITANFAAKDAGERNDSMKKALDAYSDLFDTMKQLNVEVAARLATLPVIAQAKPGTDLAPVLAGEGRATSLTVRAPDGTVIATAARKLSAGIEVRPLEVPLPGGNALEVDFVKPDELLDDRLKLAESWHKSQMVAQVRSALPFGIRIVFLGLVSGAALAAIVLGFLAAGRVTRRIERLVAVARSVSRGEAGARARLGGTDEMAELGGALDTMLDDLGRQRGQIEYLQRIGAWQDVARRLAHEIKNPLTPIQLAVQQCVSSYQGDDPRFKRLLADTGEIVEEEIAGLRRLVDTFRTLGQLPRVEAAAIELAGVVGDVGLDPAVGERLVVRAPDSPVQVRADKLLLKRVLANLVENGIHAGQEAGRAGKVTVSWRADAQGRHAIIHVDDEGKGVAAGDRERIFEPYVTTKATGTGLGLAIAKKIALEHGGNLDIAADPAPTGGARFVLTVPLAA